jgi:cysteine synthase
MIEDAERQGLIRPGATLIEATSGNTGVGLAFVAAVKGYRLIIVMPESMSVERRRLMQSYGARLELTPREKGMKGAIERAKALLAEIDGSWMPRQFVNPSNPEVHARTTAREIMDDFPEGFDYFVTGIGTGGHISGVGRELKRAFPSVQIVGVEPADSSVLTGGCAGAHPIQGIGPGFVPETLDRNVIDRVTAITGPDAFRFARRLAREEGILCGISTGASLAAVERVLAGSGVPKRVLTFGLDTGERYLSVEGLFTNKVRH